MKNMPSINGEAKPLAEVFSALKSGEMTQLNQKLCGHFTAYTDSGGHVSAALTPLLEREMVVQAISHLARKSAKDFLAIWANINGQ